MASEPRVMLQNWDRGKAGSKNLDTSHLYTDAGDCSPLERNCGFMLLLKHLEFTYSWGRLSVLIVLACLSFYHLGFFIIQMHGNELSWLRCDVPGSTQAALALHC